MDCNCEKMRAFLREAVFTPAARAIGIVGLVAYISLIILIFATRPGNFGPAVRFEVM